MFGRTRREKRTRYDLSRGSSQGQEEGARAGAGALNPSSDGKRLPVHELGSPSPKRSRSAKGRGVGRKPGYWVARGDFFSDSIRLGARSRSLGAAAGNDFTNRRAQLNDGTPGAIGLEPGRPHVRSAGPLLGSTRASSPLFTSNPQPATPARRGRRQSRHRAARAALAFDSGSRGRRWPRSRSFGGRTRRFRRSAPTTPVSAIQRRTPPSFAPRICTFTPVLPPPSPMGQSGSQDDGPESKAGPPTPSASLTELPPLELPPHVEVDESFQGSRGVQTVHVSTRADMSNSNGGWMTPSRLDMHDTTRARRVSSAPATPAYLGVQPQNVTLQPLTAWRAAAASRDRRQHGRRSGSVSPGLVSHEQRPRSLSLSVSRESKNGNASPNTPSVERKSHQKGFDWCVEDLENGIRAMSL